jgi:alpha-ribazole phosphatase
MKLHLARHTHTNYNNKSLLNSNPFVDVHLTKKGIKQAKELAQQLAHTKFDVVYISELPRTRQTADIINKIHQLPIIADGRLNDHASGYEGKPVQQYMAAFLRSEDQFRTSFNDGESLENIKERTEAFLNDLKEKDYSSVLVVSHRLILEAIFAIVHGLPFEYGSEDKSKLLAQGKYLVLDL